MSHTRSGPATMRNSEICRPTGDTANNLRWCVKLQRIGGMHAIHHHSARCRRTSPQYPNEIDGPCLCEFGEWRQWKGGWVVGGGLRRLCMCCSHTCECASLSDGDQHRFYMRMHMVLGHSDAGVCGIFVHSISTQTVRRSRSLTIKYTIV